MAENIKVVLEKIDKETPLTGNVSNIIDDPYQKENAPSLELMKKAVAARQLLINNDFQCNQRGANSYISNGYTLDMWYLFRYPSGTSGKVDVIDNGIKLTNGDFNWVSINQAIPSKYRGKTITVVAKVSNPTGAANNLIIKESNTPGGISVILKTVALRESGRYEMTLTVPETSGNRLLSVAIQTSGTIEIEYIDLFEGDVAFPHVKEDYGVSLLKCLEYLLVIRNIDGTGHPSKYMVASLRTIMKTTPTLTINGGKLIVDGYALGDVSSGNISEFVNGSMSLVLTMTSHENFNHGMNCRYYGGEVILSCEYL